MVAGIASSSPLYLYPLGAGVLLGVLQIAVYFAGHVPVAEYLEHAVEGTQVGEAFDWLNLGRVPFAVLLMLLLVTFGMVGVVMGGFLPSVPAWTFSLVAAPAAVVVTKKVGDGLARVVPKDETYAVTADDLIGLAGPVTLGPLDDGHPGNVVVRDRHGESHTLRARPVDAGTVIDQGAMVVVVSRDETHKGRVFLVMPFEA